MVLISLWGILFISPYISNLGNCKSMASSLSLIKGVVLPSYSDATAGYTSVKKVIKLKQSTGTNQLLSVKAALRGKLIFCFDMKEKILRILHNCLEV